MSGDLARRFAGAKVLITGGLGTIGSTLALALDRAGADLTLVDVHVPSTGANDHNIAGLSPRSRAIDLDIRDTGRLAGLLPGLDVLFNMAGLGCHSESMQDPLTDLEMNARAHLSLVEGCRKHSPGVRIVYASTRQVYGRPERLPVDESHPVRPVDINGIHRAAAEQYHLMYHRVHGLAATVLRLTNVYGPRMRICDSRQVFLGAWIRAVLEDRRFEVWGGDQLRDILHVEDAAAAFLAAALEPGTSGMVLNVGTGIAVSLEDLARLLVSVAGSGGYDIRPFPPERRNIDIGDFCTDIGLASRTLGWSPRVSLEVGLAGTLDYYRERMGNYT